MAEMSKIYSPDTDINITVTLIVDGDSKTYADWKYCYIPCKINISVTNYRSTNYVVPTAIFSHVLHYSVGTIEVVWPYDSPVVVPGDTTITSTVDSWNFDVTRNPQAISQYTVIVPYTFNNNEDGMSIAVQNIAPCALSFKQADNTWKAISKGSGNCNVNGTWKLIKNGYVKHNNVWKELI